MRQINRLKRGVVLVGFLFEIERCSLLLVQKLMCFLLLPSSAEKLFRFNSPPLKFLRTEDAKIFRKFAPDKFTTLFELLSRQHD